MKPRSQILEIQNQDRARGIEKKKPKKTLYVKPNG